MKIAIVGNLGQNGYIITKALRQLHYDADLYITCKNNNISDTQNPANYEKKYNSPDWVKIFNTQDLIAAFIKGKKIFSKYDTVIAITLSPAYIQFFNKNFISIATGSDLREFVFQRGIYSYLLRQSYQKTRHIFYLNPDHQSAIKRLKLESKASFLPYPIEISRFDYMRSNQEKNQKLTIFWPTAWSARLKGTNKFIDACAKLFDEGYDFNLRIIDHTNNDTIEQIDKDVMHGFIKKYKKQITIFNPIKNKESIFEKYYQADIVADQFQIGSFGMITAEALCCKKPVMIYFNNNFAKYYNNEILPGLICNTQREIYSILKKQLTTRDQNYLDNLGEKGYEWIKKNHSHQEVIKKIIDVL